MFGSGEPCKPGAHCVTLEKLYSEEQKLYKDVKVISLSKHMLMWFSVITQNFDMLNKLIERRNMYVKFHLCFL